MAWTIKVSKRADKQLRKLNRQVADRITKYIKDISLLDDPRLKGKGLTGNLRGLWRYRVENYRIICDIIDNELVILVLNAEHKNKVYRD